MVVITAADAAGMVAAAGPISAALVVVVKDACDVGEKDKNQRRPFTDIKNGLTKTQHLNGKTSFVRTFFCQNPHLSEPSFVRNHHLTETSFVRIFFVPHLSEPSFIRISKPNPHLSEPSFVRTIICQNLSLLQFPRHSFVRNIFC